MPREVSLDSFIQTAVAIKERALLADKIEIALRDGYVPTERSSDQPTKEERDDQISVITRVMYSDYASSEKKKVRYIGWIVRRAERTIRSEKALKLWTHEIPSRRSLERSVNYAADKRWFLNVGNEMPSLICIKAGWYFVNPWRFDDLTKQKLWDAINEFKQKKSDEIKKMKMEQMRTA